MTYAKKLIIHRTLKLNVHDLGLYNTFSIWTIWIGDIPYLF